MSFSFPENETNILYVGSEETMGIGNMQRELVAASWSLVCFIYNL